MGDSRVNSCHQIPTAGPAGKAGPHADPGLTSVKGCRMRSLSALALAVALSLGASASAGASAVHVLPASASGAVQVQPVSSRSVYSTAPRPKQTFFGRLMELERRKNAWLKRTFLGR